MTPTDAAVAAVQGDDVVNVTDEVYTVAAEGDVFLCRGLFLSPQRLALLQVNGKEHGLVGGAVEDAVCNLRGTVHVHQAGNGIAAGAVGDALFNDGQARTLVKDDKVAVVGGEDDDSAAYYGFSVTAHAENRFFDAVAPQFATIGSIEGGENAINAARKDETVGNNRSGQHQAG